MRRSVEAAPFHGVAPLRIGTCTTSAIARSGLGTARARPVRDRMREQGRGSSKARRTLPVLMEKDKLQRIPEPTIQRLPLYYRCLSDLRDSDREVVSSEDIASRIPGVKASQFRKDLSYFGEFGVQGVGYLVEPLLERISGILHLDRQHDVALVGAGNLGSALLNFAGFRQWGFHITRVFDSDPDKVGRTVGGLVVENANAIPALGGVSIGIIAVPTFAAPAAARALARAGCIGLLNFSGAKLILPPPISVRNVDLTNELSILSYKLAGLDPRHAGD